jgi:signal transduction histidine kinase
MSVDVTVDAGTELPAAVEVVAYTITGEALANAARHAAAGSASVRLERDGRWLTVTVADDGCGLRPDARPGVGLVSMRRRAEELGGTLDVTPAAGGTRTGTVVTARLPLEVV